MAIEADFLAQERRQLLQAGKGLAFACSGILDEDAQDQCFFFARPPQSQQVGSILGLPLVHAVPRIITNVPSIMAGWPQENIRPLSGEVDFYLPGQLKCKNNREIQGTRSEGIAGTRLRRDSWLGGMS